MNSGLFRGALSASDAADFYSVNLNANSAVYVNFNGDPEQRPGVRLWNPTGTLVSSALAGQGLAVNVDSGGLYTIEVLDNSAAGQTQNYVGVVQSSQKASFLSDLGDSFDQASVVPAERDSTFIAGQLSSLTDVDVYSISLTTMSQMYITLQLSGSTGIPTYGRQISIFDKHGAFVATTENDQLYLGRHIGSTPGEYFLVINATSTAGLGLMAFKPGI